MLKKKIAYVDYNGNQREEDFYFDLSQAELVKMEFTTPGGMEAFYKRIIDEQDMPTLYKYFEDIIQSSYGVKSLDGKQFEKSPEILRRFVQSPAYSILIMELLSSTDAAAAFCNSIIPQPQKSGVLPGQAPVLGVVTPDN